MLERAGTRVISPAKEYTVPLRDTYDQYDAPHPVMTQMAVYVMARKSGSAQEITIQSGRLEKLLRDNSYSSQGVASAFAFADSL